LISPSEAAPIIGGISPLTAGSPRLPAMLVARRCRVHIAAMLLFRAIVSALGTLVMRSLPLLAIVLVAGFWTGWFAEHPGALVAVICWLALLLVEASIEYRRWRAKRSNPKTRSGSAA
jgi:hypothetical protein